MTPIKRFLLPWSQRASFCPALNFMRIQFLFSLLLVYSVILFYFFMVIIMQLVFVCDALHKSGL